MAMALIQCVIRTHAGWITRSVDGAVIVSAVIAGLPGRYTV
jgi:hypothetical protein